MDTTTTILVTGATGKTGSRVARVLRDQGHDVRAMSRSTDPSFDWDDQTTWAPALTGVSAIYVVAPAPGDPETPAKVSAFARLAAQHGAIRAVMASIPDDGTDGARSARQVEQQLSDAGLELTVLRLRWFAQTFSEDFLKPSVMAGEIRVPAGDGGEAFVDADDIAEVAAACLTDARHSGGDYELTGPEPLTFTDVARQLSDVTGSTVTYTPISEDQYVTEQQEQGAPGEWVELSAGLYQAIASGSLETTTDDLEAVLGRPARPFGEFAEAAEAAGAWHDPNHQ